MFGTLRAYLDASIERRLALGMTTMLLLVPGSSTVFLVRAERREMEEILQEKGKTAVNMISPRIARFIAPGDATAIASELAPVLADRDFDYVYVFDATRVLANASDPGVQEGSHIPLPALGLLRTGHSMI